MNRRDIATEGMLRAVRTDNKQLRAINADLLAALKNLIHVCRAMDEEDLAAKEAARAAITKAEGGSL